MMRPMHLNQLPAGRVIWRDRSLPDTIRVARELQEARLSAVVHYEAS